MKTFIIIAVLLAILFTGVAQLAIYLRPIILSAPKVQIEWKENSHGVEYFTTCVEGFLFIRAYRSIAGPIGECDQEGVQK